MTYKEKVRELARKHQGTMTDSQYLQMIYALEEMAEWKEQQMIDKAVNYVKELCRLNNIGSDIIVSNLIKAMKGE